ncbi:MAG TPA: threonine ammonia-lyase [Candidatus Faecivivens stercoripullorum]|uniref:L-threonine dehydratase catabolic TdcB n=1 Tax=Candidatus Faecivivens stercoripullorum TaxID=2840805 RepID=A0A9D1H809_9FIRM|nr:threonine ammonia-lyase [Candidatus Faecivivens stercoripullorum]
MFSLDKVYQASFILKKVLHPTELVAAPKLVPGCELYLKPENLQVTGSFKVRGAYYKMSQLSQEEKDAGVIACSAGNHAQGVALAAKANGIQATICIPAGAPISKVEATKSYGAEVVLVKGVYDDAYARAVEIQKETGKTFIHPYDDEDVIAGQGTIGLEIMTDLADVDAVVVPIGGGGLVSGVAFAVKSLNPRVKVYGVQAAGAPSMYNSMREHEQLTLDSVSTFADGIAVKHPGDLTYQLCEKYVDEVVTVTDDEIATAILALIEQQKMVSEGAGAVAVAACMFGKIDTKGKKVVCVVSGGNIDVNILSRVISRGLLMEGRLLDVTIALADKPGELTHVSDIIASTGANIISVRHTRSDIDMDINSCFLSLQMETRNKAHADEVKQLLAQSGYQIVSK